MKLTDNVKELAKTARETVMIALEFGTETGDIRRVLQRDHMLVTGLVESILERTEQDAGSVTDLLESLRSELLLHAKSEERVLYEACKRHGKDLRDFGQEGYREHECVELLLNQLSQEKPGKDGEFKATLTVLKELLEHHMREEEGDLFPMLAKEFSQDQLLEMGEMMENAKNGIDISALALPSLPSARSETELH